VVGEDWVATVFEPALGEESIRVSNVVNGLEGGLQALEACGLLEPGRVADCHGRLRAAHQQARRRPPPEIRPPHSVAARPSNVLRHVLAPPVTPLADIAGITLVLASVELWTRSVWVRAAGMNNSTSDRLDQEHHRALQRWGQEIKAARARGASGDDPPRQPGERLMDVALALTDDLDTEYRSVSTQAGGTGTEWHLYRSFEPAVPDQASQLTLKVSDADGQLVRELVLDLPEA